MSDLRGAAAAFTLELRDHSKPCEHGEHHSHMLAQKGMAQMMWTCPGGEKVTLWLRDRMTVAERIGLPVYVLVEEER